MRRTHWIGCREFAGSGFTAYREETSTNRVPSLDVLKDEVVLHDFAAIFSAEGGVAPPPCNAAAMEQQSQRALALYPATLSKYNVAFDKWVTRNADLFVAIAASGDLPMLEALLSFAEGSAAVVDAIDWTRVVEVASVNGHQAVIDWVASSAQISERENAVAEGRARALASCVDRLSVAADEAGSTKSSVPVQESAMDKHLYLNVLVSPSILGVIRSYLESPLAVVTRMEWKLLTDWTGFVDRPTSFGALPRIAIMLDDLESLQSLYYASRLLGLPKLSFHNAMHIAACEGRLEILQWLHTLPDGDHKCRPDTMAMAVRGGYSEVVAWLHTHCPESEQSMSRHAINAAARSGLVDVLRTCLRLGLGEFTSEAFYQAAQYGKLAVLKLLEASDHYVDGIDFKQTMKYALEGSHVRTVKWLDATHPVPFDSELLLIALQAPGDGAMTVFEHVRATIDLSADWVSRCVDAAFESICATGCGAAVKFALAQVGSDDPSRISRGLLDAVRQVATGRRVQRDAIQLLLRLCVDDGATLGAALKLSVELGTDEVVTKLILDTGGDIPSADLHAAFVLAVESNERHLSPLIEYQADEHCPDALALMIQHEENIDDQHLCGIFPRRTRESSIRALQVPTTSFGYAAFLLRSERQYYTERILLENMPGSIAASYIAYVLQDGRKKDPDAVAFFGEVARQHRDCLTSHDVEALIALSDPELNGLVTRVRDTLFDEELWAVANSVGNERLMQYMTVDIPMTASQKRTVLASAMDKQQTVLFQALYDPTLCTVSATMVAALLKTNNLAFVTTLLEQNDALTDETIFSVLLSELRSTEPRESEERERETEIGSSLLVMLVSKRPGSHQRLLEIAAEAGSTQALLYMLSARSGVVLSQLQMLPAMAAAVRGGEANTRVIKQLYEARSDDAEAVTVARVRVLAGIGAESVLLPLLEQWDAGVRAEITQERAQAAALFGIAPASKAPTKRRRHVRK